jgi:EF-P beta-lysylation protein EpmB
MSNCQDFANFFSDWRKIYQKNFRSIQALVTFLELTEEQSLLVSKNPIFPLNLPFRLASKMKKRSLECPLVRQFLPLIEEERSLEGFTEDPLGEMGCRKEGKLLHKYQGRALLVCTSACAMNCRYCFRQDFEYEVLDKTFGKELEYIEKDETITEVILSGGDPLSLSNRVLKELFLKFAQIPHLKRIRFHTRFPIGIPERIDEEFLELIEKAPFALFFVIHVNVFEELDEEIFEKMAALRKKGAVVLSQTVLLKGINDSKKDLKSLFETLVNGGVIPYYIHQLDRAKRVSHFEVPIKKGKELLAEVAKELSGYALPRFVQEIPGEPGKVWL